jgi:hypothetical protein
MSRALNAEMPAIRVFDPNTSTSSPDTQRFYEEIRQTVDSIIGEYGDIDNLPPDQQQELKQRLLDVRITLKPDGEIVHE